MEYVTVGTEIQTADTEAHNKQKNVALGSRRSFTLRENISKDIHAKVKDCNVKRY